MVLDSVKSGVFTVISSVKFSGCEIIVFSLVTSPILMEQPDKTDEATQITARAAVILLLFALLLYRNKIVFFGYHIY